MTARRFAAALTAAVAGALAVGATGAMAGPTNVYLCYSKFQVDPGVWSLSPSNSGGDVSASALIAQGYWLPFAETSTPTSTTIGGWYLHCNPPGATTQSAAPTTFIGGAGETAADFSLGSIPGYYPVGP